MCKSWDAPATDELTTCVTEHHSALVHRLWQLSGQGDHLVPAVGNIPYGVTEEMLTEIFSEVGPVKYFR